MLVNVLEVALFAMIGLALLVPVLRSAVRKMRPNSAGAAGAGHGGCSAEGRDELRRWWAGWIGGVLFAVAIMNFLAFSVHTSHLGGSADSSRRVKGRYYVSAHGKYTEVTEPQWRAVHAHEITVYVTHPVGLIVGGALLVYAQRHRGKAKPDAAPDWGPE